MTEADCKATVPWKALIVPPGHGIHLSKDIALESPDRDIPRKWFKGGVPTPLEYGGILIGSGLDLEISTRYIEENEVSDESHFRRQSGNPKDEVQLGHDMAVSSYWLGVTREVTIVILQYRGPVDNRIEWCPFLEEDVDKLIWHQSGDCLWRLVLEMRYGPRGRCQDMSWQTAWGVSLFLKSSNEGIWLLSALLLQLGR